MGRVSAAVGEGASLWTGADFSSNGVTGLCHSRGTCCDWPFPQTADHQPVRPCSPEERVAGRQKAHVTLASVWMSGRENRLMSQEASLQASPSVSVNTSTEILMKPSHLKAITTSPASLVNHKYLHTRTKRCHRAAGVYLGPGLLQTSEP